jgi:predicted nucleic acid-binding protein
VSAERLFDMSAWVRFESESIPDSRTNEIAEDYEMGRLAVCLPFLLEVGYSARDGREHAGLLEELLTLPILRVDETVERRALDAHAQLARIGHHRMPPVDVMIAAIAERYDVSVLHYDSDYDILSAKTDLDFDSEWLMPRGSVD